MKSLLFASSFLIFGFTSLALATTSSCPETGAGTVASPILCNLYENAGDYPLMFTSGLTPQTPGYVVVMDSGNPSSTTDDMNQANWSAVLDFVDNGLGESDQLELLFTTVTFPTYATITGGADPYIFIAQNPTNPTVWNPNGDGSSIFNMYLATPSSVPEPSGYVFVLCGLLAIGAILRRRRAAAVPDN